jgi:hypothetical protein
VFVGRDQAELASLIALADRTLTTRIAKAGTNERDWPFPGRGSILFASERDVHDGSLRALAVPAYPPQQRQRLQQQVTPAREIQIIDPQLLAQPTDIPGRQTRRSSLRTRSRRATR